MGNPTRRAARRSCLKSATDAPGRFWVALTVGLGVAASLSAQPVPVPTPPVVPPASELAPPRPAAAPADLPQPAQPPREIGKPDDDLRLDVRRYVVDDTAPAEVKLALARLTAAFTGRQRGFEDLINATAEVTRYMQRDLGYYLGYAYLPEQTPVDGVIRIAVLEGRLDRVQLNWRDGIPVDRAVVEGYLSRLQPGSVLTVRDVERVVSLVNDLRGMTARFELRAGSEPGTSLLVVTPSPERVVTGQIELDANGTQAMGKTRAGGLLVVNSPFGRGDGFTANALSSTTGGLGFALLGYTTPLGRDGAKVGASLSGVRYQLDKDLFPLDLNGTAVTGNVYGLYPVVRSRNLNVFSLLSLEHKSYTDRQDLVGGRTRKNVQTVALGSTGDFRDSLLGGGVTTYDLNLSSGRVNYPDGRSPTLDDDPSFTKLSYGLTRLQDLVTGRALVYFSLRGQFAANNLDTTEQFRVGGPDSVRALESGEGTGDIGTVVTLELRLLPPEAWFGRRAREFVFSLFADGGHVQFRHRPRVSSDPDEASARNSGSFSGVGFGLSWVQPGDYAVRLALAKPTSGSTRGGDKLTKPRLTLQAAMLFK
jgi:hemolysin activation/secretion protein